jgi:multisubunit Na+/H+ antiporter MnhE subunit
MEAHDRSPSRSRGIRQLLGIWFAWWAVLVVVWLLLVDTVDAEELLVGAVAASVAATVAAAVHRRGYILFSPRVIWLREVPWIAWNVVRDCGLLADALWRKVVRRERVRGVTLRVPFHHGGDNGRDGARRALVNFAVSLTPNSYVVDIDPEGDSLLVHRLAPVALDRVLLREEERATSTPSPGDGGDDA